MFASEVVLHSQTFHSVVWERGTLKVPPSPALEKASDRALIVGIAPP